ncbi:MAG: DUF1330 domain-containing protein [Frankiales bacterium]|nr:DUF1330 domain-containing protein [Frankiales bacterium]
MSAYMIFNYTIDDADAYQAYPPAAMPSIGASGAEILVADYSADGIEGTPGHVNIVLRFPSKEAAMAWYTGEEYTAAKRLRQAATSGHVTLSDGFTMPS